ncbi:hypothetical protein [Streptomyces sp. 303MFCol5.2]|uniref:hypothetical protein n=1 Tax=Streptomyces sp. 303MFCol5.2 TaxID=1172181 RepID=UPI00035E2B78|nr:hypothetical protein [Streptomyces sp. 303MFCol5.2]
MADAPLPTTVRHDPAAAVAFDPGTGTGAHAAVPARRPGPDGRPAVAPGLHPGGGGAADGAASCRADLVVRDPAVAARSADRRPGTGVYDEDSGMSGGFPAGLGRLLRPAGGGRPILSEPTGHLGPRTREELLRPVETAGPRVVDRTGVRPLHRRSRDVSDPLYAARAAETISLWRLTTDPQVERQPPHGPE